MKKSLQLPLLAGVLIGLVFLSLGWTPHNKDNYHSPEDHAFLLSLVAASELPNGENALFTGSGKCAGCHGQDPMGLANVTEGGWDINPTDLWRSSIMANSAKDPFWRAKVSHEVAVNPEHQLLIEDKCTSCHAPLGHFNAHYLGAEHYSFAEVLEDSLALDGVSCNACHQQDPDGLGTSFSGQLAFVADTVFGPFGGGKDEAPILAAPMTNFVGFEPVFGEHILQSELCADCHTLITKTINVDGTATDNSFVEQATYHEWLNSIYGGDDPLLRQECQQCHMPKVDTEVLISANYAFLEPRGPIGLHTLVGANTFMLEMFRDNIELLGLAATEAQFDSTIAQTLHMLQNESVLLQLEEAGYADDTLAVELRIENLAGHKFPSGYPSRRAYVELIAQDDNGNTLFHSGAMDEAYEVVGHDEDYEPHYDIIRAEDEVQIYEQVIADNEDNVTTVLLRGHSPLKDNRLVPKGFSSSHITYDTTLVAGLALNDPNFNREFDVEGSGTDEVTYRIGLNGYEGQVNITARLMYQAAPPKWNQEMFATDTPEIEFFQGLYEAQGAEPVEVKSATIAVVADFIGKHLKPKLNVYPNPSANGWVQIDVSGEQGRVPYRLFAGNGQLVQEGNTEASGRLQLNAAPGTYVLVVNTANGMLTTRLLVLP